MITEIVNEHDISMINGNNKKNRTFFSARIQKQKQMASIWLLEIKEKTTGVVLPGAENVFH